MTSGPSRWKETSENGERQKKARGRARAPSPSSFRFCALSSRFSTSRCRHDSHRHFLPDRSVDTSPARVGANAHHWSFLRPILVCFQGFILELCEIFFLLEGLAREAGFVQGALRSVILVSNLFW